MKTKSNISQKKKIKTFKDTLKITCGRSGKVSVIPRVSKSLHSRERREPSPKPKVIGQKPFGFDLGPSHAEDENESEVASCLTEKTSYFRKKIRELEHWNDARDKIEQSFIESQCMPQAQRCILCHDKSSCEFGANVAETRCVDCGIDAFMCIECCLRYHRRWNRFHFIEMWEDGTFMPLVQPPRNLDLPLTNHKQSCMVSSRLIKVADAKGRQFDCILELCTCHPDAYFFIRHGLWPATSVMPRMAFTMDFMGLLDSLYIESQVSIQSFCASICLLTPPLLKLQHMGKDLLKALQGESYQEYRIFKYNTGTLRSVCNDYNNGTVCPACPSDGCGVIIESIDACFGLVHKKAAGKYTFPSRFENLVISNQKDVDSFVSSHPTSSKTATKECNNFQAGSIGSNDSIHAKGKSAIYDIKGIIGSICRHEFPKQFLNLKHGERIGYSVYLIKNKLEQLSSKPDLKYCVQYDIACILKKHLQKIDPTMLNKVTLALPSFHSYAHIPSCQVELGPKRVKQVGLSDGEQCERLWSYLRCFSAITKEMTISHRNDVLTAALLHYGKKSANKLHSLLTKRMDKAVTVASSCRQELTTLLAQNSIQGSINDVESWIVQEKQILVKSRKGKEVSNSSPYAAYVQEMLANRQLRQQLMIDDPGQDDSEIASSVSRLKKSEKQLAKIEKECGITKRWDWSSNTAKTIAIDIIENERGDLIESLRTLAHERKFLLQMKNLYANGQKLAKTLSTSIGKRTKGINDLVIPFNRKIKYLEKEIPALRKKEIDLMKAKDHSSELYGSLIEENDGGSVPQCIKHAAIDLYCRLNRAEEEMALIKSEMINVLTHHLKEQNDIEKCFENYRHDTLYDRGTIAFLKQERKVVDKRLSLSVAAFIEGGYLQASDIDIDQFDASRGKEIVREAEIDSESDDVVEEGEAATDGLGLDVSIDYFDY